MKDLVEKVGKSEEYLIDSSAVSYEEDGCGIYPPAAQKLRQHGIPFGSHAAHRISADEAAEFDLLLIMDSSNERLISRIITFVAALITLMGTGAAALLLALLCLLVLPIAALLIGGTMLLGFFRRGWQNEQLRGEIAQRTVYLFFPSELNQESFSARNMKSFAQSSQATVFIISPYSWSTAGLGGNGFYINARREGEHLFLLRRHYFFFFRRLLSAEEHQRIVVIL